MHTSVLLNEVIEYLDPKPGDFIIDGTLDGGGHAAAILEKVGQKGKLLGVDQDESMIAKTKLRFAGKKNIACVHGNYADLPEILASQKLGRADGLLLDLGFSSEQLESSGRGFSFMKDEPLLMTYDPEAVPVKQLLRELSDRDLAKIIFAYSGEKSAMRIARAIKERGKKKPIVTSGDLAAVVRGSLSPNYERGRIDPATRTFQALRIYANGEMENIKKVIEALGEILKPGGRAVIISFHSLEDRIVKHSFRDMEKNETLAILTKKPILASEMEVEENPRSRSAKLRAIKLL